MVHPITPLTQEDQNPVMDIFKLKGVGKKKGRIFNVVWMQKTLE